MMSKKLLGIVIGGSVGGLFFIFIMVLLFSPGVFFKGMIKEWLGNTFGGRARAEGVTFGWRKGIELSDFVLLREGEKSPTLKARKIRLKCPLLSLLHGQCILRLLEVSDMEVTKGLRASPGIGVSTLGLKASHLLFTDGLERGSEWPIGGGHIILKDGLLTGKPVSALMEALGQQGGGYAFESISTDFEAGGEGEIYLKDFLARGALFDLELEGKVEADQSMDCNATIVISKEKAGKKVKKLFSSSGTDALRIPLSLGGDLSTPRVSIKTESLVEELFKSIF
ncbi:MAG: hypothetical protein QMD05_08805 [Candidatus Brocadiaceae bacterium]|nr:hypothetical protein [Candidatus Brocadiaceae bacterium]